MEQYEKPATRYAVLMGACLTQFTVIGILFSYGLFFKEFEAEFGWSRTVLSGCASLAFFMMGVLAVFAGRLSDRYGPSIVLGIAGLLFGLGFAGIALVTQPWQLFLIFGLFIALGMSTHDVVTLSTVARWFDRRRGIMTGVVKVGTALGQIVVPSVAASLIAILDWRMAAITLGLAGGAILMASAAAVKRPGRHTPAAPLPQTSGMAFDTAVRTRLFWSLCAIQFLYLPTLTTVPLHIVVHGMDLGMTPAAAAVLLSVTGAASIAGRLTIGASTDRIGGKKALLLCFIPLIISLLAILAVSAIWPLYFVVAIYGFAHGGFFTIMAPTIAEYFGTRAHGAIFGAILFFGAIGGAGGPLMAGWVFDTTGSYAMAFATLAAMTATGLALASLLPASRRGHSAS